jgi:DNA/RNA-binding domain of Phe-tRNA-synthetase-like protein
MNGETRQIKANDMMMRDALGVVCTIIYGQDGRTAVTKATRQVLYVTYVPAGITAEMVARHHEVLLGNVRLVAAEAVVLAEVIEGSNGLCHKELI